jgi:hypothetical protein
MKTIVIYNDFENFPTFYVLNGDFTHLDGVVVGAVDVDQELEDMVADLSSYTEVHLEKFPMKFIQDEILQGVEVAVIQCGFIP